MKAIGWMVLGCLMGVSLAGAQAPLPQFYYYQGQPYYLEVKSDQIHLRFSAGFDGNAVDSFLSRELGSLLKSWARTVSERDVLIELTDRLDFIAKYNIQYGSEASGGYTHYAIATLQNELTDDLDIDISLEWDYVSRPVTGEGGITPKSNDYRMMLGISYSY